MRVSRIISAVMAMIMWSGLAFGQEQTEVSGRVEVRAGNSFQKGESVSENKEGAFNRNFLDFDSNVNFKRKKLLVDTRALISRGFVRSEANKADYSVSEQDSTFNVNMVGKDSIISKLNLGADFTFMPNKRDIIALSTNYSLTHTDAEQEDYRISFVSLDLGYNDKTDYLLVQKYSAHLSWDHQLKRPGSSLNTCLELDRSDNSSNSIWGIHKFDLNIGQLSENIYRITPWYRDNDLKLHTKYRSADFLGVRNLNFSSGMEFDIHNDVDSYSGANLHGGVWADSLEMKNDYNFMMLYFKPSVSAGYSISDFDFSLNLRPLIYKYRLQDDTGSNSYNADEGFSAGKFSMVMNASAGWSRNSHSARLGYERKIDIPDFLILCSLIRPGEIGTEFYLGNPDLKPTITNRLDASYVYSLNKLSAGVTFEETLQRNCIERTFYKFDYEGEEYTVYTWINSGKTSSSRAVLRLDWNGDKFKSHLGAGFNHYYGINKDGVVTRSNDYNIRFNAAYSMPWKMDLGSEFRYQSKIQRMYGSTSMYINWDLRLTQHFKLFDLMLEGLDLLDKPITTTTVSASDTESGRYEEHNLNRRYFRLRFIYNF